MLLWQYRGVKLLSPAKRVTGGWNPAAVHMASGSFLLQVKQYATKNAEQYGCMEGSKALIDQFEGSFGSAFDSSLLSADTITPVGAQGSKKWEAGD